MSTTIMCKPRNEAERKMLIDAGIITPAQKHRWVFLEQLISRNWDNSKVSIHKYWNVCTHYTYKIKSLRLTVKQFIDLFKFITLSPEVTIEHLIPVVENTSRNREVLKYYCLVGDLISDRYQ